MCERLRTPNVNKQDGGQLIQLQAAKCRIYLESDWLRETIGTVQAGNSRYCNKKLQNCRNNCRNKPVMALSFDILLLPTIPDIKLSSDERSSPQLIYRENHF